VEQLQGSVEPITPHGAERGICPLRVRTVSQTRLLMWSARPDARLSTACSLADVTLQLGLADPLHPAKKRSLVRGPWRVRARTSVPDSG
jgi:hypothetical protein